MIVMWQFVDATMKMGHLPILHTGLSFPVCLQGGGEAHWALEPREVILHFNFKLQNPRTYCH